MTIKIIQSKICENCNIEYIRKRGVLSDKQWNNRKFCSSKCFGPTSSKNNKGNKYTIGKNWAGDKVCISGLHIRIRKLLPQPLECTNCQKATDKLDLANISQEYKSDLTDWEYLCRKCHMTKDGRLDKAKKFLINYKIQKNENNNHNHI